MNSELDELGQKLDAISAAERAEQERLVQAQKDAENRTQGIRVGVELVAPIVAGVFIGSWIDGWAETKPVFMVIMLLLGVVTGFANVWRITQNIGGSIGYSGLHPSKKDGTRAPTEKDPKS